MNVSAPGPGVILVSGKGGTGKSTVALALARRAAASGRRTLFAELDAQRPALPTLLGRGTGYEPAEVAPRLSVANLTWAECLDDWLKERVGAPRIVRGILKNRVVSVFLEATPGARDLVVMARVAQLARSFDTLVVDMPASGNAVAMMVVAQAAAGLFDAGPVRRTADDLLALYARADTHAVLVAIPEEMVVTETLETARRLHAEVPSLRLGAVVLNRAAPGGYDASARVLLGRLRAGSDDPALQAVLDAGEADIEREDATAEAESRLREGLGITPVRLPLVPRGDSASFVASELERALAADRGRP